MTPYKHTIEDLNDSLIKISNQIYWLKTIMKTGFWMIAILIIILFALLKYGG